MAWTQALKDVTLEDVPVVGGKNASLGEMLRELTPLGVRVPDGFAVTAEAYRHFCRDAGLDEQSTRSCAASTSATSTTSSAARNASAI